MNKIQTDMYEVFVLSDEDKNNLMETYGIDIATSDKTVPVSYGILNKETKVCEHYCANLPQAMAVLNMLQSGYEQELENFTNKKPTLRSV